MTDLLKTREFLMTEKLFSIRDKVNVMDINKEPIGIFSSKLISLGKNYRLYDIKDQEKAILTVKEKVVSLRSSYTFFKGDKEDANEIGKLKAKLVSIKPNFWFEDPSGNKLFTMKGKLFRLTYKILKEDKEIAEISKKLPCNTDGGIKVKN